MIMLGHLSVPALDPSGLPVTLSQKSTAFLRREMGYKGILITDAMNMGGIGKFPEEKACLMALQAGVDIVLHPSEADRVVSYLESRRVRLDASRLEEFRRNLPRFSEEGRPDFRENSRLSGLLTEKSLTFSGSLRIDGRPLFVILNDEEDERGDVLARRLRKGLRGLTITRINRSSGEAALNLPKDARIIVAIFSETRGWKGGSSDWLYKALSGLAGKADIFISFGSPYLLDGIKGARLFAYWDCSYSQEAVARFLLKKMR
jgi:hypothetical protein